MRSSRRSAAKSRKIPVSGISVYVQEKRADFEASHTDLTKLQVFNAMNEQWTQLDPNIKLQYERRADYLRRSEARKATVAKRDDALNTDQPPITGYSIFVTERHHSLKMADSGMTLTQRSAQIADEWNRMSAAERRTFINIAKRETRKFRRIREEEDITEPSSDRDET